MIVVQVDLEPGFRKADVNNIPHVSNEAIFNFVAKLSKKETLQQRVNNKTPENDLRVDFVQIKKIGEKCEARAIVFPASGIDEFQALVAIKVHALNDEILETTCEICPNKSSCSHILAFIFWLHRKSSNTDAAAVGEFWGSEVDSLAEEDSAGALRVRDIFACNELRIEADMETENIDEAEGNAFLQTVLNEMAQAGLHDSVFYRHCRPTVNEFEPIFVHHVLLDATNYMIKNPRTFMQHMEDQAKQGVFERLAECSKGFYKSTMWFETQYMRLRCSIIQRISARKSALDDEQILETMLCKEREFNVEERQKLKEHKRFILKQTEKLENKVYQECGLLLSESYPYIVAAPDGITDDHIVEIKVPKTEEEFEKYLEGRETIAPKYMAQIQIQMYMANVTKALYCVLSPTFDVNGALHYVWVTADMEFVASLLTAAEDFWKETVFPRLIKMYKM